MNLRHLAALALLVTPASATAQHSCSLHDSARVRKDLASEYATFRDAFMKNAPQAWIDALDSSFTLTLFNGSVMSRAWVENYVRTNATQFHIDVLQMAVQTIMTQADTAVATVLQTSDRRFTDETGAPHRLEVGARQLETWVCTSTGWRLWRVKEDSVLYLRRDGKPPS